MSLELLKHFDELLQNFRWADALDIAVISALVYAGLVWFKQAASRSLIVGATVLTALYFVARAFDMYLTLLVFHATFAVLLIVLVVLFQEEIRRIFERVAGWGTLKELRQKSTTTTAWIDSVVEATFSLAAKTTGALIVVAGREPLQRHVDGGIELAGRITKPILYSIFDPNSAGHDGAVIIERDRIGKFGAHLPISKNHDEIRGRGTRHSAALGVSECSDALTIVVSEERGVVSVTERGQLVELKTAADLKDRVEQFLNDRFPPNMEATWKRYMTRNTRWKVLAILIAVAAWVALAFSAEKVQTSVVVPIEYRNLPEGAEFDESPPVDALVTLSGNERAFRLFDRRVLKISLDVSDVKNGTATLYLTPADVRQPPNLKVDRIQPDTIILQLKPPRPVEQKTTELAPAAK